MKEYRVEITRPAELDLTGIYTHIADTLKEPRTARRLYMSIKKEIMKLSNMPERCQVISGKPYAELGVRKLLVENYIAFYVVDKERRSVSVLRILYNRREWQHILGTGGIPFDVSLPKVPAAINADAMTVKQLRTELMARYEDMKQGNTQDASTAFAKFREAHR